MAVLPEGILFTAAPERGHTLLEQWGGQRADFWCVLGHTDTGLIPGLSTAGVSEDLRAYTPAADAEVVTVGAAKCLPCLPSSPFGPPGPSGITRAALQMAAVEARFFGAGLRVWPATECERISEVPGADIRSGAAVADARALFESGIALGRAQAAASPCLVIGESVPGGTTTALALLLALGYQAAGRVSGSMPGNAHELKTRIAREALAAARLGVGEALADPLLAVSRVGDPMQPLVAGMAMGATRAGGEVLLAGGSQMLAVAALIRALEGPRGLERIGIGTTRWIVEDPTADVVGLAAEISLDLPVIAVNLNFSSSRHAGLRAYEGFMVKEGVGAGGACIAALAATSRSLEVLHERIEVVYDELLGRLTTVDSSDSRRR